MNAVESMKVGLKIAIIVFRDMKGFVKNVQWNGRSPNEVEERSMERLRHPFSKMNE